MTDPIGSRTTSDLDRPRWDPPSTPPKDARAERLHADSVHADIIDKLPWHPPACDFANMDQVAACPTSPVAGGVLYVKGKGDVDAIDPNDVKQNGLGDCYFLAAVSSLAQTPEGRQRIHDMIKPKTVNGKTVYEVTFREPVSRAATPEGFQSRAFREVTVEVPADKFVQGHASVADREGKQREIWPLVLEAGYAKYKDGYENMANGGQGRAAFTALTGREGEIAVMPGYDVAHLKRDFAAHKPIVVSLYHDSNPEIGPPATPPTKIAEYNIHFEHMYSVVNVFEKNGETYVQLRNPWGTDDPKPIPARELMRLEAQVETGDPSNR